jgi:hypothetical protein
LTGSNPQCVVLMCWCWWVDVLMCWCADVLVTVLMCWRIDRLVI